MLKETLIAFALTGQTITRDTTVSILLVVMLLGATVTITTLMRDVQNDIANVNDDVAEIKSRQDEIYQYVIGNPLAPKEPGR